MMSGNRSRRSLGHYFARLASGSSISLSSPAGHRLSSMKNRYDVPVASSLATDPSPSSPSFADLASRATNNVFDYFFSARPVPISYVLFRRRDHKELSVAVAFENNRPSGPRYRQPPFGNPVNRGPSGRVCVKFDSMSGSWCLRRHGHRPKGTKAYTRPPGGLSAIEEASICGCATISPWEKSWKFVLQFEGLEEGQHGGLQTMPFADIVGEEGSVLMKTSADGALRRVDVDDVPATLRFMWLAGRPAVILDDYEQKRFPRTLDLSTVEVMQCNIKTRHIAGTELHPSVASETSSGHPTPDQILYKLGAISGSFVKGRDLISSSSSRFFGSFRKEEDPRNESNPLILSDGSLTSCAPENDESATPSEISRIHGNPTLLSPHQSCRDALNRVLSSSRHIAVTAQSSGTGDNQPKSTSRCHSFIRIQEPKSESDLPSTRRAASVDADGCQKHIRFHSPPPSRVNLFTEVFDDEGDSSFEDADDDPTASKYVFKDEEIAVLDEKTRNVMICTTREPPASLSSPLISESLQKSPSSGTLPISISSSGTIAPSSFEIPSITSSDAYFQQTRNNPPFSPRNLRVGLSVSPFPSDYVPSVSTAEYIDHGGPHSELDLIKQVEGSNAIITVESPLPHAQTAKLQNLLLEERRWRERVGPVNEWYHYPPVQVSAEFLPERLKYFDWGPAPTPDRYDDNIHWGYYGSNPC